MIKPSFIPPPNIRHIRDLLRFRMKLTYQITGMKNRSFNCPTVSNLKLDDVFSDVFGKSLCSIIKQILEHPIETFDVTFFVDKRCKYPIEGTICFDFIDEQEKSITELDFEIFWLAEPHKAVLDFIRNILGLSKEPLTAICILSEIYADMSEFPTSKHLVSWAGCCPRNDSSAQKVKSTRISRASSYLKPLFSEYLFSFLNNIFSVFLKAFNFNFRYVNNYNFY